jgi:hypothetical protein
VRGFGGRGLSADTEHPIRTLPLKGRAIAYELGPAQTFVLSLSKDLFFFRRKKGKGFDRLSPNG